MEAMADGWLLERFVAYRDEAAFAELVRRHTPVVRRVCQRLLPCAHDAEDASQATFVVLACKAGLIRQMESVGGWLYKVAYRISLKAKASSARRFACIGEVERVRQRTAACAAHRLELLDVLDKELDRLPHKYRNALVLRYMEGKSIAETAQELGCRWATTVNRLWRARHLLRNRVARRGLGLSKLPES